MGMRPVGGFRAIDRLIDLDAAERRQGHARGARIDERAHQRIAGLENRASRGTAQQVDQRGVGDPDAEIRVAGAETEIEQRIFAVSRVDGLAVGSERGDGGTAVSRAGPERQTEQNALLPTSGTRADRFIGERDDPVRYPEPDRAARSREAQVLGRTPGCFLGVAEILRDRA